VRGTYSESGIDIYGITDRHNPSCITEDAEFLAAYQLCSGLLRLGQQQFQAIIARPIISVLEQVRIVGDVIDYGLNNPVGTYIFCRFQE
jgi:hypothetical protein